MATEPEEAATFTKAQYGGMAVTVGLFAVCPFYGSTEEALLRGLAMSIAGMLTTAFLAR